MSDLIKQDGFPYLFDAQACQSCEGRCCTGESGNIFVNSSEMAAMAAYLGISVTSFQSDYLVKKGYKFSIKEKIVGMSHDCIFFDRQNNGCKVYEVRPKQCITFPFWEYYKTRVDELKRECPGIVDA